MDVKPRPKRAWPTRKVASRQRSRKTPDFELLFTFDRSLLASARFRYTIAVFPIANNQTRRPVCRLQCGGYADGHDKVRATRLLYFTQNATGDTARRMATSKFPVTDVPWWNGMVNCVFKPIPTRLSGFIEFVRSVGAR